MKYAEIVPAVFLSRPNRFIAQVMIRDREETVHVKNTGRCKEILIPGAQAYLSVGNNPKRKTKYDLVAVEKKRVGKKPLLINIDSQIPNDAVAEWLPVSGLFNRDAIIRREVKYGDSRVDFYIEDGKRKIFCEVKGVTLEFDGVAMFPDAPTERGVKHLHELCKAIDEGYEAMILFVIQMKEMTVFKPNNITHPEFAQALKVASDHGVKVMAMDCIVTPEGMWIDEEVEVSLE